LIWYQSQLFLNTSSRKFAAAADRKSAATAADRIMSFSASSSTSASGAAALNITISEKLTRDNFLLWQTQVLPEIRGAQLFGFLDGSVEEPAKTVKTTDKDGAEVTVPNPEHARWIAQDQTVLGFLVRNMAKEVLTQMVGLSTSAAVWKAVVEMFSAQSQSRVVHLRTI
jgi:hypothetical protein